MTDEKTAQLVESAQLEKQVDGVPPTDLPKAEEPRRVAEKKPRFVGKTEFKRGLEDVISNETTISYVDGDNGKLLYRGYDIADLIEAGNGFEETAYLLLYGRLPKRVELRAFERELACRRALPVEVKHVITRLGARCHPMSTLRTAVSILGCLNPKQDKVSVENNMNMALSFTAQFPTIVGAIQRVRRGEEIIEPDQDLTQSEDLLRMLTGERPDARTAEAMDIALIIHAEHGMNASTFSSLVTSSSLTDFCSAIVAGIGSLKGPLHGGANEASLRTFLEIGDPDKVNEWYDYARKRKIKVSGFGHRVYRTYDPRALLFDPLAKEFSNKAGTFHLYQIAKELEKL
ncbi:MAG: citrate/2-methylcitrate synthase, partial [Gemmatimonadota bacterium]